MPIAKSEDMQEIEGPVRGGKGGEESKKSTAGNYAKSSLPLSDINNAARSTGSQSGDNGLRPASAKTSVWSYLEST